MFYILSDKEKLQHDAIRSLLRQTFWANTRPEDLILRSIRHSECYGAYLNDSDRQVAFARVVSDFVSVFYLCDVIVDQNYRGHGIGKALVEAVVNDPRFQSIRGILTTSNASSLYEKFGFVRASEKYMVREPSAV